jgi:carbamoyltransferase
MPILFNTSFNLGGEPLVETLDDAVRTLANSLMEYLYLPEYGVIIEVKNND